MGPVGRNLRTREGIYVDGKLRESQSQPSCRPAAYVDTRRPGLVPQTGAPDMSCVRFVKEPIACGRRAPVTVRWGRSAGQARCPPDGPPGHVLVTAQQTERSKSISHRSNKNTIIVSASPALVRSQRLQLPLRQPLQLADYLPGAKGKVPKLTSTQLKMPGNCDNTCRTLDGDLRGDRDFGLPVYTLLGFLGFLMGPTAGRHRSSYLF